LNPDPSLQLKPALSSGRPRIHFIVNPAAAGHRAGPRWNAFKSRLHRESIPFTETFSTGAGHAREIARLAASEYDVLAAVGGDGTVREVAEAILAAPDALAALAVIPFGTGNDAAAAVGIRFEEDALWALTVGLEKSVDVIQIECEAGGKAVVRHALLFAAVGIIAESLKKTTEGYKRLFGQRMAYPVGLIRALVSYRSPLMRISSNEWTMEERLLFAGASNTAVAGGGMLIAPGAQIDDGWLNINLISDLKPWSALMLLRRVCRGGHINHPKVRYLRERALRIGSDTPLEIAADGDLIGQTPAVISIRPRALSILVPGP
jgi:YegS/Rv2252/BmrU family lipid kinase